MATLDELKQDYGMERVPIRASYRQPAAFEKPHGACYQRDGWVLEIVGDPREYILLHEFLHVVLEETGRRITTRHADKRIEKYLFELKNMFDDFLIETEVKRKHGTTYLPLFREHCNDTDAIAALIHGKKAHSLSCLMHVLSLRAICTHVYSSLRSVGAAAFTESVLRSGRFDDAVDVMEGYQFSETRAEDYHRGICQVNAALTEEAFDIEADRVRIGLPAARAIRRFVCDVENMRDFLE